MSALKFTAAMAILLSTTACGDTWGQRAVTGGAIGAGSGAVIGWEGGWGGGGGGGGDHAGALIAQAPFANSPATAAPPRRTMLARANPDHPGR